MENQYIEFHDEGYWILGTRISLDSIVYAFREGLSPETIARDCFPSLSLEQVYGAIAYYLGHQADIDEYLLRVAEMAEQLRQKLRAAEPEYYRKLMKVRRNEQGQTQENPVAALLNAKLQVAKGLKSLERLL